MNIHKKVFKILKAHKRAKNVELPTGNQPVCFCGWQAQGTGTKSMGDRYRGHLGFALVHGLAEDLGLEIEPITR